VRLEIVRVEYDPGRWIDGIKASGLPDDFAEYLEVGGAG
jgi:hypothetical protein